MRSILITASILFSILASYSQKDTSKIPFIAYWAKGDVYSFKVSKINQVWKQDSLTKNDTTQYLGRFEVIDSTDKTYKIKWSYQLELINTLVFQPELADRFSNYGDIEVIYLTNQNGEFTGIENWLEVSDYVKKIFTDIIEVLVNNGDTLIKQQLEQVFQPLMAGYSSKEGLERFILKELNLFHFPFGLEYTVADTLFYEESLPNLFGGEPIKGDGMIYFEEVDFKNYYCILVQEITLNEEDTRKLMIDALTKMGLKGDDLVEEMKGSRIDMRDYNFYEYYYDPGIPIYIETIRTIHILSEKEKMKRIDKTIIEWMD